MGAIETENVPVLDTIKDRIRHLFISKDMSDCEFEFHNKEIIKGHKYILGVASPVFQAMFFGDLKNKTGPEQIVEIEPESFHQMLEFIYTDDVEFKAIEPACLVYAAAEKYILPQLKKHCEDYITLHADISTVSYLLDFVSLYTNENIEEECLKMIRAETSQIINSKHFIHFDIHILNTIVKQCALNIDSEAELFKAIENWAMFKAEELGVAVSEIVLSTSSIISNIRFLSMNGDVFAKGPGVSELLSPDEKIALSLNIFSPGVCPIPKNLCQLRKERSLRVKHVYTFTDIPSSLTENGTTSPEFRVKTFSWSLLLKGKVQKNGVMTHAVLYIQYNRDSSNPGGSCNASVELKFLPCRKIDRPVKTTFKQKFSCAENSWCNPLTLMSSEFYGKGFMNNKSITVEASVEPEDDL